VADERGEKTFNQSARRGASFPSSQPQGPGYAATRKGSLAAKHVVPSSTRFCGDPTDYMLPSVKN
jgi:hypothetical protein